MLSYILSQYKSLFDYINVQKLEAIFYATNYWNNLKAYRYCRVWRIVIDFE